MREERGKISGNLVVTEPIDFWGTVVGNVTVVNGGKLYMRGAIYGALNVAPGGRVHVFGNIGGNLTVETSAKVIHSGVVAGDAINNGGRLYIEAQAKVLGKVKTHSGETKIDSKARIGQ